MLSLTHCLSAVTLLAAMALSWAAWPAVRVANQRRERIVVLKDDFNPPVKIKAVKTKGKPIKTDEKFLGEDDWFEGLTASVVNNTGKEILSISIDVFFLRPEEQAQERPLVYQLDYGADPFNLKPGEEYQATRPPIPTGRAVAIELPGDEYHSIKAILGELNYLLTHRGIKIRISSVGFSDGTVWHTGTYYRRDPTAPSGWREIEVSKGSARNGTAKFLSWRPAVYEPEEPARIIAAAWARPSAVQTTCGGQRAPYGEQCSGMGGCFYRVEEIDPESPTRNWAVEVTHAVCTATNNGVTVSCGTSRPSTKFYPVPDGDADSGTSLHLI